MGNEPNWGNTHADDCPVTTGRKELWESFCQAISQGPSESSQRDYLWGAVIEWCAGGDEDHENCDCTTHRSEQESARIRNAEQAYYARKLTTHTLFNELQRRLETLTLSDWASTIDTMHHDYHNLQTSPCDSPS
jgi:hypothetical protein